jgi:hypothetical protein
MNRTPNRKVVLICLMAVAAGCQAAVETTGKQAVDLNAIPQAILELVNGRSPGFEPGEAESEIRNGQTYYDIEGETAAGEELEFDITQIDGQWSIVETQRDIAWEQAPAAVRDSLKAAAPDFLLRRIIESDQGDGVIIYEFFGSQDGAPETKLEVRYADGAAELLTEEWVH